MTTCNNDKQEQELIIQPKKDDVTGLQEINAVIQKRVCYTKFVKHSETQAFCGITTDGQLHISSPASGAKFIDLDYIFWKNETFSLSNYYNHNLRFRDDRINYEYIIHDMSFCTNGNTDILGILITSNTIVNGSNLAKYSYSDMESGISILGIIRINMSDPETPYSFSYSDKKRHMHKYTDSPLSLFWLTENIIHIDNGIIVLSEFEKQKSNELHNSFDINYSYQTYSHEVSNILKSLQDIDPITAIIIKYIRTAIYYNKNSIGYDMYCQSVGNTYLYFVSEKVIYCFMLNTGFDCSEVKINNMLANKDDTLNKSNCKPKNKQKNKLFALGPNGQLAIVTQNTVSMQSDKHAVVSYSLSIYNLEDGEIDKQPCLNQIYNHAELNIAEPKTILYDNYGKLWLHDISSKLYSFDATEKMLEEKKQNINFITKCNNMRGGTELILG